MSKEAGTPGDPADETKGATAGTETDPGKGGEGAAGQDPAGQGNGDGAAGQKPATGGDEPKPYLGDGAKDGQGEKPAGQGNGEGAADPKPATDDDYMKALAKDEKVLGGDGDVQFDEAMARAVLPTVRELGLSPEAFNRLANAVAKAQVEQVRERTRERAAHFEKMNAEAQRKYSPRDFEQINAGIDRCFRTGGTMNFVVRNSELGSDPEFLALMHRLGGAAREDNGAGAAAGGGEPGGDPNGADGMAKMW